jgi:hypothetical protein
MILNMKSKKKSGEYLLYFWLGKQGRRRENKMVGFSNNDFELLLKPRQRCPNSR